MTDYKKRLGTAIATVAILANAYTPLAFAGTTINITENGPDSNNDVVINNTSNTSVNQTNTANFTNNVDADADTGSNTADKNNGGNVSINTGDATVNATVSNSANQNWASVDCCAQGNTTVKVAKNGPESNNTVNLNNTSNVNVTQDNDADFENNVKYLDANTGDNYANKNNGGDVEVRTGDASVKVAVSNWANGNSARVGGDGQGASSVNLTIAGNGPLSENGIGVNLKSNTTVNQKNYADIDNNVDGDADTGYNTADENNGGDVLIDTGDATVDVTVDNMANFNWADLNCGCLFGNGGLTVDVDQNGPDSNNTVNGNFNSTEKAIQDNDADFENNVKYLDADTGNNDTNENNSGGGGDPSVRTGDAEVNANVSNSANVNGLGGETPDWPEFNLGGIQISLNFNLSDILDALGL